MSIVSFIPAGRLGNFFFTCSAAFAYAKKHGLDFSVPYRTSNDFWSPIYLHHLQNPNFVDGGNDTIIVREHQFHYSPIEFREEWRDKNIILSGYFQSNLYFKDFEKEMFEAYKLPRNPQNDVCSLHARFGDYRTIEGKHILVDAPYIQSAIDLIISKTKLKRIKVFSDDIPFFIEQFGHLYPFEYSTNDNIWDDFIEITNCHSHINSSSTFSWWGAYANPNPNKVIITQKKWFQEGWDNADTKDIIPENWIKL